VGASACNDEIKSYMTSNLGAIENLVKSKTFNNDFSGVLKMTSSGVKVCP
jgi:hypothetical protein